MKNHKRIANWILCSPYRRGGFWYARARRMDARGYRVVNTRQTSRRAAEEWAINYWIPSLIAEESSPRPRRFEEAFEEFLGLKTGLRSRSRAIYQDHLRLAFLGAFGGLQTSDISPVQVEGFMRGQEVQGVASSTRAQRFKLLRAFFRWAILRDYCTKDPTAGLKAPRAVYQEKRALTPQQMAGLFSAVKRGQARSSAVILTALSTGLRRGNLLGMRLRNLDLIRRAITFTAEEMKTGVPLEIPISLELMEVLKERVASLGTLNPEALIWGSIYGVSETLSDAGIQAGIPGKITLHTLRHTYATWLADKVPYAVRQRLLGHSNRTMTDHYTHLSFETLREWVDRLPRLMPEEARNGFATG